MVRRTASDAKRPLSILLLAGLLSVGTASAATALSRPAAAPTSTKKTAPTGHAVTTATPIASGNPVGVAAGDYVLTLTVSTTNASPVNGLVAQYVGGGTQWDRVVDFRASQAAKTVSAEVRISGPADTFVPFGFFGPLAATNLTLAPAHWSFVARGPDIVDPSGAKVIWHGVNANPSWSIPATVDQLHAATSASIVRVPVYEQQWLPFFAAEYTVGYRQHIIDTVNAITADGMTAIITLMSAGHDDPNFNLGYAGTGQLGPDQHSIAFWRDAASLWAGKTNVIFELFNEPRLNASDAEPGGLTGAEVWRDGGTLTFGSSTWNAPGMQQLADTVRAAGAANMIIVPGTDWSSNLLPVQRTPLEGTNLVYAFHAYAYGSENPTVYPPHLNTLVAPIIDPKGLRYASLATEFGTPLADSPPTNYGSSFLTSTAGWISAHGLGWLVWGWYQNFDQYGMLWGVSSGLTSRAKTIVGLM